MRTLREELPRKFPGITFYFLPADIMTQTLNFGLPAPIDIQITGSDIEKNSRVADKMMTELSHVRGITDLRIQQQGDYPKPAAAEQLIAESGDESSARKSSA